MTGFLQQVSFQEKILFTKHLSTMVKAGIPVPESLATLILQTKSSNFKNILQFALKDVDNGQSLSKALSRYPRVFDEFYVSLIKVSEESGTLEDNLEFMAKQLTKEYQLRKKVGSALLYPGIVVSAIVIIGGFVSFWVLPKLVDFFRAFDAELPLTTRILLFIAEGVKNYGFLILGIIVAFVALICFAVQNPRVKFYWHILLLKFPIIGPLYSYGQLGRFSRNLGTLIKSGVPISVSLNITANTMSNLKFKRDLQEIEKSLTKGKEIGVAMDSPNYWEYPAIVSKMIKVGEKTGKLDETLLYLSDFYEDEIDDLSKNLSTILEPVLLVIIGLAVGFLALAIISPVYELTGSIRR